MSAVNTTYFNSLIATLLEQAAPGTAIAGPLHSCKVGLYSVPVTLTPQMTMASFTEAVYTGYAELNAPAWGAVIVEGDGSSSIFAASGQFTVGSNPTEFCTVYGYFVNDGETGTPNLLFAEQFDTPIPMQSAGAGFLLSLKYNSAPSVNSAAVVVQ